MTQHHIPSRYRRAPRQPTAGEVYRAMMADWRALHPDATPRAAQEFEVRIVKELKL